MQTSPEASKAVEVSANTSQESTRPNGDNIAELGNGNGNGNGKKKNAVWIKLFILLAIIAVSLILYKAGFFKLFLSKKNILSFLDSLGPLSFVGFIILQAAQVVLAPIPGELTGLIGGYTYGPVLGVILSTIGLVIGSYLAFALSRTFGRPFVDKFVSRSVMERFDYVLHHKGLFLIFMLFLLPGFPKDYLCLILGLGHLTTAEFLVISSVGRLMGTILLTLGGGYIRYHQYQKLFVLVGVALVILGIAMVFRTRVEEVLKSLHLRNNAKPTAKPAHTESENR